MKHNKDCMLLGQHLFSADNSLCEVFEVNSFHGNIWDALVRSIGWLQIARTYR
jgi:hypothetical protein